MACIGGWIYYPIRLYRLRFHLYALIICHDAIHELANRAHSIIFMMRWKPKSDIRDDIAKHVTSVSAKESKQYDHYKPNQQNQ
jgi:hypothetical protein